MRNRFILISVALTFSATLAHAQLPRYCDTKVAANAFYSNVESTGVVSVVTYFTQLQNQSNDPVKYTVKFTAPRTLAAQNGSIEASLTPYQQVTVMLGKQSFDNPAGSGQLGQADMIRYTNVNCPR